MCLGKTRGEGGLVDDVEKSCPECARCDDEGAAGSENACLGPAADWQGVKHGVERTVDGWWIIKLLPVIETFCVCVWLSWCPATWLLTALVVPVDPLAAGALVVKDDAGALVGDWRHSTYRSSEDRVRDSIFSNTSTNSSRWISTWAWPPISIRNYIDKGNKRRESIGHRERISDVNVPQILLKPALESLQLPQI